MLPQIDFVKHEDEIDNAVNFLTTTTQFYIFRVCLFHNMTKQDIFKCIFIFREDIFLNLFHERKGRKSNNQTRKAQKLQEICI